MLLKFTKVSQGFESPSRKPFGERFLGRGNNYGQTKPTSSTQRTPWKIILKHSLTLRQTKSLENIRFFEGFIFLRQSLTNIKMKYTIKKIAKITGRYFYDKMHN